MSNCPYCNKSFNSWLSVRGHIPSCSMKTNEYYIHKDIGPIHFSEFYLNSVKSFNSKYPEVTSVEKNSARKTLRKYGFSSCKEWTLESAKEAILKFYKDNGRNPTSRDVKGNNIPSEPWSRNNLNGWNSLLIYCGLEINNNGFGNMSKAKDGVVYRSSLEAKFVDKFLYLRETYIYEKPYPGNTSRISDFYLPDYDLYIEIAGGLRPEVIQEKISYCINNKLGLLVIRPRELDKNSLNEILLSKKNIG